MSTSRGEHPVHGCKDPLALAALQILIYDRTKLNHLESDELACVILRAANPKLFDGAIR